MLGDDILLGDRLLAERYLTTITELGLEISLPKSYEDSHLMEFAKRLIYKGEEISPAPIRGLISCGISYTRIASFWRAVKDKDHVVTDNNLADCTENWIRSWLGDYQNNLGRAHYKELRSKVRISASLTKFFQKEIGPASFMNELMTSCGYSGIAFSKEVGS